MGVFDSGMSLTQRLYESGVSKNQEFSEKANKVDLLGGWKKTKDSGMAGLFYCFVLAKIKVFKC
jgi:hypothetical protein